MSAAVSPAMAARRTQLVARLNDQGVDAFFACAPNSMGYLHGFFEFGYERLMIMALHANGETRMICPALSASQAERCGVHDIRPWADGEDPIDHVHQLAADWGLKSAMIAVDDTMSARHLLALQEALPAALFQRGGPIMADLRSVKDADELAVLRRAAAVADAAFDEVVRTIQPGITEIELQDRLADAMRRHGGQPTFTLAAFGPNSAEPHHIGDTTRLAANEVALMDFGCMVDHYNSDITRCVCVGSASDQLKSTYRTVYQAFIAGRKAIRAGVSGAQVDAAARQVITEAGHGDRFIHRLGHGIGLDGHEEPNLIGTNHDPLPIGACCSVEPGIYLPGEFGIRIENVVTVTDDGHESLNAEPVAEIIEL